MNKESFSIKTLGLVALISLLFFVSGYFFHAYKEKSQIPGRQNLSLFWQVWDLLEEKYPFEQPAPEERIYAAISGLVAAYGDDYSGFLKPEDNELFEQTIHGEFGGAGMEIGIDDGFLTIIAPLKDSPAERAGFLPGDIITHVNGEDIMNQTFNQVLDKIRGEVGTECTLTIIRPGESLEPRDITFVREIIQIPVLDDRLVDDVYVISLYNFNDSSEALFKEALIRFKESGSQKLILDLRNNPGGYLISSIDIASYFIPAGKVIVREDYGEQRKDENQTHRSLGYDLLENYEYQMIVLINEGSASASEIVAGALQDHEEAIIAGETSFGKGSVQDVIDLGQNASLKITIAKWLTPKGSQISDIGINPDVIVYPDENKEGDSQLEKTIELFGKNEQDILLGENLTSTSE